MPPVVEWDLPKFEKPLVAQVGEGRPAPACRVSGIYRVRHEHKYILHLFSGRRRKDDVQYFFDSAPHSHAVSMLSIDIAIDIATSMSPSRLQKMTSNHFLLTSKNCCLGQNMFMLTSTNISDVKNMLLMSKHVLTSNQKN